MAIGLKSERELLLVHVHRSAAVKGNIREERVMMDLLKPGGDVNISNNGGFLMEKVRRHHQWELMCFLAEHGGNDMLANVHKVIQEEVVFCLFDSSYCAQLVSN